MTRTVYVELLGESVDVWRPVEAERVTEGAYRLMAPPDYDPTLETWRFEPGSIVRCEDRPLSDGTFPVAVARVEQP